MATWWTPCRVRLRAKSAKTSVLAADRASSPPAGVGQLVGLHPLERTGDGGLVGLGEALVLDGVAEGEHRPAGEHPHLEVGPPATQAGVDRAVDLAVGRCQLGAPLARAIAASRDRPSSRAAITRRIRATSSSS